MEAYWWSCFKGVCSLSDLYLSVNVDDLLDDVTDSGTRQKPTKPVMSSNKSSTFPAKCKSDNEQTHLKQPHQDAST